MNKNIRHLLIILAILGAVTLSCNFPAFKTKEGATQQNSPASPVFVQTLLPENTGTSENCLVGTWQLGDLQNFILGIMPKIEEDYKIESGNSSGQIYYQFTSDGKVNMAADNYKLNMRVKYGPIPLPLNIKISGTSTAEYTSYPENKTITITGLENQALQISAQLAGQDIISHDDLAELIWFGANQDSPSYLIYECDQTTLRLTSSAMEDIIGSEKLTLFRISP